MGGTIPSTHGQVSFFRTMGIPMKKRCSGRRFFYAPTGNESQMSGVFNTIHLQRKINELYNGDVSVSFNESSEGIKEGMA